MSDTWTMDCEECSGSGIDKFGDGPGLDKPCPTCSGSGGSNLVVEIVCPNYSRPSTACIHCPAPQATRTRLRELCTTYRPLTVKEKHEIHIKWIADNRDKYPKAPIKMNYYDRFIHHINRGNITYKGSPVTLQPREGEG